MVFPLQLNTAGKQAFRENLDIALHRWELRMRYLRLLLAILFLLTLIIVGPHVARGESPTFKTWYQDRLN